MDSVVVVAVDNEIAALAPEINIEMVRAAIATNVILDLNVDCVFALVLVVLDVVVLSLSLLQLLIFLSISSRGGDCCRWDCC